MLKQIGSPMTFTYRYHLNLSKPTSGWRGRREEGLGGVILDLGHHAFDAIIGLFGPARHVSAASWSSYPETRAEGLDDLAHINLTGFPRWPEMMGQISLFRHDVEKTESVELIGADGWLKATPEGVIVRGRDGTERGHWHQPNAHNAAEATMLLDYLGSLSNTAKMASHLRHQTRIVHMIGRSYGCDR